VKPGPCFLATWGPTSWWRYGRWGLRWLVCTKLQFSCQPNGLYVFFFLFFFFFISRGCNGVKIIPTKFKQTCFSKRADSVFHSLVFIFSQINVGSLQEVHRETSSPIISKTFCGNDTGNQINRSSSQRDGISKSSRWFFWRNRLLIHFKNSVQRHFKHKLLRHFMNKDILN